MRILLTGATGFIGTAIRRALLSGGHEVVGVARKPPANIKRDRNRAASYFVADFMQQTTPASWHDALRGIDVVVNAVGIIRERGGCTFEALHAVAPIALFDACVTAGVSRVV